MELLKVVDFAVKAHGTHLRKGTLIPYIVHPLNVMRLLMENEPNCSFELAAAGALHDTVEDVGISLEEIATNFGQRVSDLVRNASEPDKSDTWENRKQHTIDFLRNSADRESALLIVADKLDNLNSSYNALKKDGDKAWDRFKRGKKEQWWYFSNIADAGSSVISDSRIYRQFCQVIGMVF